MNIYEIKEAVEKNPRILESLPSFQRWLVETILKDLDEGKSEGG